MKYDILIVPASSDTARTQRLHVDTERGGYWLTRDEGQFFEVSTEKGLIMLIPFHAVRQILVEEVEA